MTTKPPESEMHPDPTPPPPRPRSKRLQQFALDHGLDHATVRRLIVTGALVARRVGRITIICEDDERAWLASLPLAVPQPLEPAKAQ